MGRNRAWVQTSASNRAMLLLGSYLSTPALPALRRQKQKNQNVSPPPHSEMEANLGYVDPVSK